MRSPSTVDTMLARVTAELTAAAPDDDRRRELAALQAGLLWCRHPYIWDERVTRYMAKDRIALPLDEQANAWVDAAALVIADHNALSDNHEDFIEAARALYREILLAIQHRGGQS